MNRINSDYNASTPEASAAELVKIVEDRAHADAARGDAAVYYRARGNIEATSTECSDLPHGAELWADTARLLGLDPATIVAPATNVDPATIVVS